MDLGSWILSSEALPLLGDREVASQGPLGGIPGSPGQGESPLWPGNLSVNKSPPGHSPWCPQGRRQWWGRTYGEGQATWAQGLPSLLESEQTVLSEGSESP